MLFIPPIVLLVLLAFLAGLLIKSHIHSEQKKAVNMLLRVTMAITLWTLVNSVLLINIEDVAQITFFNILNHLGFLLGALSLVSIYVFSFYFPSPEKVSKMQKQIIVFFAVWSLISLIPAVAGEYYFDETTRTILYRNGSWLLAYITYVFVITFAFVARFRQFLVAKRQFEVQQVKTIVAGLVLTALHGTIFIVIMPLMYGDRNIFYVIGYLAPAYFVSFTSYSLFKQQLFNFRTVVLRAMAYLFTTVTATIIYVVIAFVFLRVIFNNEDISATQLYSSVGLTVLLVLFHPYIKRKFDKFTNRIFFRDSYDPQVLIDHLNQALVANLELENLLLKSAHVLEKELKVEYVNFYINSTDYFPSRLIGHNNKKFNQDEIDSLQKNLVLSNRNILYVYDHTHSLADKDLVKHLKASGIEVLSKLIGDSRDKVHGVGLMLLGPKKSGNLYSKQDLKIIEITSNELVIAIENVLRFEQIEQFNATLQKKIDESTKELRRTNTKLKELDQAKDEFISMASHQLRTPLTSIKGYISLLIDGDFGKVPTKQRKVLSEAFSSSQRMVYLIADLLNVSRLKTGKFMIEPVDVYLPDMINDEMSQVKEMAASKNITMHYEKPKSFPTLRLDDMKIRQVAMNFLDNAIHYTPVGGIIRVQLVESEKAVSFSVVDSGIGVPKSEQHHLFTKFYRAGNARKARPDGTGLGLFMAKKVIVASGGSIIFSSEEGKGSTFGFSFPKK